MSNLRLHVDLEPVANGSEQSEGRLFTCQAILPERAVNVRAITGDLVVASATSRVRREGQVQGAGTGQERQRADDRRKENLLEGPQESIVCLDIGGRE
jgi:hypothetical protein